MRQRKQAKARDVYWHMPSKVTKVGEGSTSPREIASKALRVMERLAKSHSLADEQSRDRLVHAKVSERRPSFVLVFFYGTRASEASLPCPPGRHATPRIEKKKFKIHDD